MMLTGLVGCMCPLRPGQSLHCTVVEVIQMCSINTITYHLAGEDCCLAARDGPRQCEESEGDCSRDSDCAGLLVCGQDNCISQFGAQPGELYDYGDDCCTRRCTPDTPCTHGEVSSILSVLIITHPHTGTLHLR